jgi:CHAT domain-containing protein/tetratricopeptide (TPR) repeat protein
MAWRLGDLDAARVLQEAVLEVRSRTLADDHPDLQVARANLALSLKAVGDLPAARALEEKVLEIRSAALAEDHPELQWARNNLAATLYLLGDAGSARALYAQIIGALSRTLANDHRDLQRARAGLALALQALGEFDAARTLQEAVLEASSRTLHDGHPHLQEARLNLALTLLAESTLGVTAGNEERVVQLLEAVARAQMAAAHELSQTASSREAEERCASFALYLDTVISAAFGYGTFGRSPRLESAAFALSEATRNAGLAAATAIRRAAIAPGHAELRARLRAASADLAARAQGGTDTAEFQRARVARESIERELLELLQDIGASGFAGGAFGASSVAAALQPGQVAIAYRRYARSTVRGPSVDTEPAKARAPCFSSVDSLCAFVVRGTETTDQRGLSPLVLVDLGPLTPIETAVETWRDGLGLAAGRGLRAVARAAEHDQTERGATIRRLVLDPLRAVMAGAERVTLVLDDVLHLVPFDALPAQDTGTKLLGEILRIETRTTLGELLDRPLPPSGQNELVGLGGVDYDLAGSDAAPRTTTAAARILRAGVGQHAFSPLPGTRREIHGVTELFARSAGQDAVRTVLSGTEATGRNLVERAPRARWLHLATHGWHASDSLRSSSDPEAADRHTGLGPRLSGTEQIHRMSPMLLCGLALAGANLPENAVGRTPGLMTAEELSTLDLSNCELAVLSACDTNVGKRRAGQGVASLQRAMQMAGTRSAITSLWKVPDEATEKLMLDFYRRLWVEKKPKGQALWEAKMAMREAATERGLPEHPLRDWAAWVLTGEPH